MKIWLISQYSNHISVGKTTSRQFELAKAWVNSGHQVSLFTSNFSYFKRVPKFKGFYKNEIKEGIKIQWIKVNQYKKVMSIARVLSWFIFEYRMILASKKKYSKPNCILVSSLSIFSIISGIYYKKKYRSKLIFEVRDIWPLSVIDIGGFSPSHPFIKLVAYIEKLAYKKADFLSATMPNAKEHMDSIAEEAKSKPFKCIPHGFSLEKLKKTDSACPEFYLPRDKFIIGYAGSMGNANAVKILLEAVSLLPDIERLHIALFGDGEKREVLEEEFKDDPRIKFYGYINQLKLLPMLKQTDLLFDGVERAKLYDYGLSRNKWIDYMLAAKPMLVSFSGYQSTVNEAGCGWFVPAGNVNLLKDKIVEVMDISPKELKRIGEKGRAFVLKNRTYEKLAQNYLSIFKSLV